MLYTLKKFKWVSISIISEFVIHDINFHILLWTNAYPNCWCRHYCSVVLFIL